ncbi:unnamed protein product [Lymnaea stagnalis]|uniref:Uncharacterized protein n=1 Tax=Lymnaea stagnalis TaxID=6523 RepID=A0AAV2H3N7_LYMST
MANGEDNEFEVAMRTRSEDGRWFDSCNFIKDLIKLLERLIPDLKGHIKSLRPMDNGQFDCRTVAGSRLSVDSITKNLDGMSVLLEEAKKFEKLHLNLHTQKAGITDPQRRQPRVIAAEELALPIAETSTDVTVHVHHEHHRDETSILLRSYCEAMHNLGVTLQRIVEDLMQNIENLKLQSDGTISCRRSPKDTVNEEYILRMIAEAKDLIAIVKIVFQDHIKIHSSARDSGVGNSVDSGVLNENVV